MEFSDVKQYIDTIKDDSRFKELAEFTRMTRIQANKDMYENIERYVKIYHHKEDDERPFRIGNESFEPDYDYVIKFIEQYMNNEPAQIPKRNDGYLDLANTMYLIQPGLFSENRGNFLEHYMIMTDKSIYILKLPLNYRGNSGITNQYCFFSPLIASYIAKNLGVECADIALAKREDGNNRIVSKSFLRKNEEIVTYTEDMDLISKYLDQIDEALRLRRFDESEIEKVKFDFIKQEFVAKLIGLKDQTADNSPLIVDTDENENRHVRMAPMFDLDFSFHIAKDIELLIRQCDNGNTDIGSLIEQYKDYPGFKQFAKRSIEALDMEKIFKQIYDDTGIKKFGEYMNDEQMKEFIRFVNRNIQIAKETFDKVYESEREER